MSLSIKLSALTLVLNAILSSSAYAAMDEWDSTGTPWGSSVTAQYAEWNEFGWTSANAGAKTYYDATPDVAGSGTLKATGTPIITSTSNIYSWQENATAYSVSLAGSTGGFFDVYLRAATMGLPPSTTASLNGVAATLYERTYYHENGVQFGQVDAEYEFYYKWSNVAGADLYTFTWNDLTAHTSLDQLAVATVQVTGSVLPATPVPEPESFAMMFAGLALMGLVARRKTKRA